MRKKYSKWRRFGAMLAIAILAIGLLPAFSAGQAHAATPTYHQISSGYSHTLALKSNHTVWSWGQNYGGALGDGTTTDQSLPVQVPTIDDAVAVSAGYSSSFVLRSDGTVWGWGDNSRGQLGLDTTVSQTTPVQIPGLNHIVAISSADSDAHSLALKDDGTVWGWGENSNGQLGNGTTTRQTTPVQMHGITDAVAITTGANASFITKSDGTIWGSGSNYGLGIGGTGYTQITEPMLLPALTDVKKIVSDSDTFVLKNDGTVWGWGPNSNGQLGDETKMTALTPVQMKGISDVVDIANSQYHTLILKNDGTVWGAGSGYFLGNESALSSQTLPIQVTGITNAVGIATGSNFSMIQMSDGTIQAFANVNNHGQLGDSTTIAHQLPSAVINDVGTGDSFNIGLLPDLDGSSEADSDDPSDNAVDQDSAVSIGSGGLSMTSSGDKVDFGQLAFSDASQVASSSAGTFDVSDLRGSGDGWHVSVLADPHSSDANSIPAGSLTLKAPAISALNGAADDVSSSITDPVLIDTDTAVNVASADVTKGQGEHRLAFTDADSVKLNVPANTPVGDYKSNIHWQLTTGP